MRRSILARRFTLVEFLVVTCIISILAALLFPALQTAMESARAIGCTNNQRQLHLLFCNYSDDWRVFPAAKLVIPSTPYTLYISWWTMIKTHSQMRVAERVFLCPNKDRIVSLKSRSCENSNWASDYGAPSAAFEGIFLAPAKIKRSSQLYMIGDRSLSTITVSYSPYQAELGQTSWGNIAFGMSPDKKAHGKSNNAGLNVTFADGHVRFILGVDLAPWMDQRLPWFNADQ